MREDTSGLLLTEYDSGSIRVEVVDYGISEYGGADLEMWFEIDSENADKLKNALKGKHNGSLEEKLVAEFGKTFNIPEFRNFCEQYAIKYSFNTYMSD